MNSKNHTYIVFILFLSIAVAFTAGAQQVDRDESMDSVKVFTLDNLYDLVFANHPVIRQADLLTEQAQQEIRYARGFFDPKLSASYAEKNFKDTEYYSVLSSELKIPVWFPLDPKIAFDRASGTYLNPERTIPESDNFMQIKAGVSLPIGQGLLIDQRRATLKQAKMLPEMLEAERRAQVNEILFKIAKDYWSWYFTYNNYQIFSQGLEISSEILERTRLNFQYGEASRVDTVQARINYQTQLIFQQEAFIDLQKQRLNLSNHLWDEEGRPRELDTLYVPQSALAREELTAGGMLDSLMAFAQENHPALVSTRNKIQRLEVVERLNREMLKPQVDLSYSLINQPLGPSGGWSGISPAQNYLLGVDFSFPLLLRKERSKLRMTQLKVSQSTYDLSFKEQKILNEIRASYVDLTNTLLLLEQMRIAVENYELLLEAEILNLQEGESDLFKINIQTEKLLQTRSKYYKMQSEYEKNMAALLWFSGTNDNEF